MPSPLATLRAQLQRRRLDGMLVSQPENRRYLSGYTASDHDIGESSGLLLLPSHGSPLLLTDSRFQLQAESEATGFEVILYKKGLLALLSQLLPTLGIKKLAFESHYLLHSTFLALEKMASKVGIALAPLTGLVEKLRVVKTAEELKKIEAAVLLNERVFQEVYQELAPGLSEREVALRLETTMRKMGAEGPSFPTIIASGPNGALPHAVPGPRKLAPGEPIVIDMGLILDGYCADMTRTVVLGEADAKTVALFRLVRQAQLAGLAALRPGVGGQEVDRAARQVIRQGGYGAYFGHGLGHGVGLAVHEAPSLNFRNRKTLRPGMVVTIEPGIYLPGWGGIRLENMAVITADGYRLLNRDTTYLDL